MLFGAHCGGGIRGAIDRAVAIGAEAVQLFGQSPRTWRFPDWDAAELAAFRERREQAGLGAVALHALYLVNLAAPDDVIYEKSIATMRATVDTACAIGAEAVIFHVGSHLGAGFDTGLARAVPALEQVLERCDDRTWLLMESSAGAGGTIGRSVEELAALFDALGGHPRLGVCLDSCHLWVSGVDVTDPEALDAVVGEVERRLGLDRLRALHVNDAKAPLGSNRDRHENVPDGLIGERLSVFLSHPAFQGLPAYLETPGPDNHGPDAAQVQALRDLHARGSRRR